MAVHHTPWERGVEEGEDLPVPDDAPPSLPTGSSSSRISAHV
ncbi:hypothetical protein ACFYRN_09320 [Streptomyces sp. NPDC005227]